MNGLRRPKMPADKGRKMPRIRPHMAFGAGAAMHHAFRDPQMTPPDQAFNTAMAMPQGESDTTPAAPPPVMPLGTG
jgi:hypothetical protein